MKKHFITLFALLLAAQFSWANVITGEAAIPDGYYNGVDGKKNADAILDALFSKISGHTVISYKSLEAYYEQTDFTGDSVWDMYSTCHFTMAEANKSQNAICDAWNKEHSIPQSWFNEGSPMKSDLFHVYPTDARVNNFRGNEPYGEVAGENGTGFKDNYQGHGLGKIGSNTFPGYTGKVFEPADEYKGDFARTYFYMVARYRDKAFTSSGGSAVFTSNKTNLTEFAQNLFLKWHRQDPVSQKEIDRNEAVYKIQGNRNPFIDYPDLAEFIWGERLGQTIDLSQMTPTCEGGTVTPIVVIKHGVSWSINGTIELTDSVKENTKPTLPETPVSCSTESSIFMGWTNAPIAGTTDEAPAVLYTLPTDFPAVTEDVTYYAVFAHADTVEYGPQLSDVSFVFNTSLSYEEGGVSIVFAQAKGSNAPKYYENGEAIRCYAKNTITVTAEGITNILFAFGTGDGSNAITSNVGTFDTNEWTGNADEVIFTIGGSSGHRRIHAMTVTRNGIGGGEIYSRYITSCQSGSEIEIVPTEQVTARKMLVGGQIYILLGDQLFNIQGQRVK